MKVLQINSTANWGSTGKIAEQIGDCAISHGWESYIAYGRYVNHSKSQLIKIGSKLEELWHLLESRVLDNHGLASRIATRRFIRLVKRIKPDIIHLHNIHGYYLNYKILFEYLNTSNIPVVWTLHDCWSFTGHCAYYTMQNCNKWMGSCESCKYASSYPRSFISRSQRNHKLKKTCFSNNKNLHLTPVSQWLESQARQSFLKNANISYIYNGIDIDIFRPRINDSINDKYDIRDKFVLLGAGTTWGYSKGLYDFIKLRELLPDKYVIILVGLNDSIIKTLPKDIIGIRRTSTQTELAELYTRADIVLSLSRQETFGMTIAEGMACGSPVIVYNTTAVPELVTNETGLVVNSVGDINGVITAINEIEQNGKQHYSEACRKRAVNYFDKNISFNKYIELYNEILNTNK